MTTAKLVSLALLLTACAPAPALPTWDAALVFDGVKLGSPIGALLARAPYDTPCDVDPIDKKTATLFFWAGGPCREAPAFPAATTLVIVTPRATDAARGEQPVTLVAWPSGSHRRYRRARTKAARSTDGDQAERRQLDVLLGQRPRAGDRRQDRRARDGRPGHQGGGRALREARRRALAAMPSAWRLHAEESTVCRGRTVSSATAHRISRTEKSEKSAKGAEGFRLDPHP